MKDKDIDILKFSLHKPIGFHSINWRKSVDITTILCPFVKTAGASSVFSTDIAGYVRADSSHFIGGQGRRYINPKFILISIELPVLLGKLDDLGVRYRYRIFIADEPTSAMRSYIHLAGGVAKERIEASKQRMFNVVKDVVTRGLALKVPRLLDTVTVESTSNIPGLSDEIARVEAKIKKRGGLISVLGDFYPKYRDLVDYWKLRSGLKGREFNEMILRDQVAYRASMGEAIRTENCVIFSGQPPEPGDYFHGVVKRSIIPTMFVYKNVEGVDRVQELFASERELKDHLLKFSDLVNIRGLV